MRAFREPMVWLITVIPVLTVIGGVVTMQLASANGPLANAPETVARSGQMQLSDLAPDQAALDLGLHAVLTQQAPGRFVFSDWPAAKTVPSSLAIVHPNRQELDLTIALTEPNRVLEFAPNALPWALCEFRLQDQTGSWRLVGRLDPSTQQVRFASKLQRL